MGLPPPNGAAAALPPVRDSNKTTKQPKLTTDRPSGIVEVAVDVEALTRQRQNLGQNSHNFFVIWGSQDFSLDAKRFVYVFPDQSAAGLCSEGIMRSIRHGLKNCEKTLCM